MNLPERVLWAMAFQQRRNGLRARRKLAKDIFNAPYMSNLVPMNPLLFMAVETASDRQIRDEARKKYIDQATALEDVTPADIRGLIIALSFNKADQEDAQQRGDVVEEMQLIGEAQEMSGQISFKTWENALKNNFGEEIGTKLANHQIEVGMTLEQLGASFGPVPADGEMVNRENGRTVLKYGTGDNASYFELSEDFVITHVILRGGAVIPDFVYEMRAH